MVNIDTYWRTVRHLRREQIFGRLWFRLSRPRLDLRPAPTVSRPIGPWVLPARRQPSFIAPARMRLLNVERDLDACGWDSPAVDRLWRYNLHYFDDLNAFGAQTRVNAHQLLMARWIQENPPARGTGWEPYPISLRIVNWVKWALAGRPTDAQWLFSLAVQARWLSRRLERYLLGNHLFANAKALVFAGLYFQGVQADAWQRRGMRILQRELAEQVLDDGGHFERSTMYHALALEDVLDLLNVINARSDPESPARALLPTLRAVATAMLRWLAVMSHPDGGIGLFNDAAHGVAPSNVELKRYAHELGVDTAVMMLGAGVVYSKASGYARVAQGPMLALLDIAPLGPDYLLGHAHADTLSFELSVGGQRLIVNGGTSCYGGGAQRMRERGTAAHSTVEVAGCNSSEVWAGFRVGRRARPSKAVITEGDDTWDIGCSHDGYAFLPGRPEHSRHWRFGLRELVVTDAVTGGDLPAVARFLLAPDIRPYMLSPRTWELRSASGRIARVEVLCGAPQVDSASYAPQFGLTLPTVSLVVSLINGRSVTRWQWYDDAYSLSD